MRSYTLVFSIVAHVCAACAVLFTTVLATNELPAPRDGAVFVSVATPPVPDVPPPARPRPEPAVTSNAAPTEPPEGIRPEIARPVFADIDETAPIGAVGGLPGGTGILSRDEPPPPPPPPVAQPPVHVGGVIKAPARSVYVAPVYPAIARAAHVSGYVILEATISEDGVVRDLRVLKSVPLLDDAAREAVRQWRFTPTLLNGQPVAVLMTVTVAFNLD